MRYYIPNSQNRVFHWQPACILSWLLLGAIQVGSASELNDSWRYTTSQPRPGWQQRDFDDRHWQMGRGGFGTRATPGARVGTVWKTNDIWLRKTFNLASIPKQPALLMHHDEDVEVYINGQRVASLDDWTVDYQVVPIQPEQATTLKEGDNLLAVHCHQTSGGQFIDVQVIDANAPPDLPPRKPFQSPLITKWGSDLTPENAWTEYPRPQLVRDQWKNLNGNWQYAVTPSGQSEPPTAWHGTILVPFCLESQLGGVQRMLEPDEALWYRRTFQAAPKEGQRTRLNFEAVDYRCQVVLNGQSVGGHQGGNTPFSFDVTKAIHDGENELIVRVEDDTEAWQLRGKQVLRAGGIWYTRVSGIWQTVWLEQVPTSYIRDLTINTVPGTGSITVRPELVSTDSSAAVRLTVRDGENQVAQATGGPDVATVQIADAKLWSPESPHLYGLQVALLGSDGEIVDQVESYTGIRSVGTTRDANGHLRCTLNGEVLFHYGPLDQGWWPDALLTPPSDEAMLFDIQWLKSAGFNMIRKHIKVEPRRYYYHCDRLGIMVWQDHVSAGNGPRWTRLEPDPVDAEWPNSQHRQFMDELEWMIDTLENHPSIVVWVPFNEAWGQHRTLEVGKWTVARDPSRLVNIASGGNFWPVGDIGDHHSYPHPTFPFDPTRFRDFVKVVGEFGGHGFPIQGHLWDANRENWGYGGLPETLQAYRQRYKKSLEMLNDLRKQGIAAGVYTQTTDVEVEINGLMTYDRKAIKIPAADLAELHTILFQESDP